MRFSSVLFFTFLAALDFFTCNAECKIDENFTIHINFTIQVQFTKQGFMKGVIGQRWSERECVFRML